MTNSNEARTMAKKKKKRCISILSTLALALAGTLWVSASQAATFQWIPNTEADLATYQLYACTSDPCTAGTQVALVPKTQNSVTITNPTVTTWYSLSAKDLSGNESGRSLTVVYTVIDSTPPATPTGLHVTLLNSPMVPPVLIDVFGSWIIQPTSCALFLNGAPVMQGAFEVHAAEMRLNASNKVEILGSGQSCTADVPPHWFAYDGTQFVPVP